mmetsp:Transcript_37742/g.88261  ORF Transcript_37742/g.88261 Transcript_37742/m.88261 type:complete len:82 (-) Transcript_37742:395-640(-)
MWEAAGTGANKADSGVGIRRLACMVQLHSRSCSSPSFLQGLATPPAAEERLAVFPCLERLPRTQATSEAASFVRNAPAAAK